MKIFLRYKLHILEDLLWGEILFLFCFVAAQDQKEVVKQMIDIF